MMDQRSQHNGPSMSFLSAQTAQCADLLLNLVATLRNLASHPGSEPAPEVDERILASLSVAMATVCFLDAAQARAQGDITSDDFSEICRKYSLMVRDYDLDVSGFPPQLAAAMAKVRLFVSRTYSAFQMEMR